MKKHLFICAAVLSGVLMSNTIKGQAFDQGKIIISAGYGFGLAGAAWRTYESNGGYKFSSMGPIHAKFEYGISEKIGMGLSFNYRSFDVSWTDDYSGTGYEAGWKGNSMSILARMNLHFADSDKLDAYWGFGIGYRTNNLDYYSNYPNATPITWKALLPIGFETSIGVRYYFTDNIGIYAEAGLGKALIQGGLAIKF